MPKLGRRKHAQSCDEGFRIIYDGFVAMIWLWNSWDEYVEAVRPCSVSSPGTLIAARQASRFESIRQIQGHADELGDAITALGQLGFRGERERPPDDRSMLPQARSLTIDLIDAGERMLIYDKSLYKDGVAYGFLHQHVLLEHWDRYASNSRIFIEISQLVTDAEVLLRGYNERIAADERFLIDGLKLPKDLLRDFQTARDLFSVGLDEVGVLIAGRGLEGVLRSIARRHKLTLLVKNRPEPLADGQLNDIVEAMARVRWKATNTPLVSPKTKQLLHYLRALRNSGAHAGGEDDGTAPRENAAVSAVPSPIASCGVGGFTHT